jgi:hypothetical protein
VAGQQNESKTMTNKWTDWFSIDDKCDYQEAAVYKVRLANANGNAYTLERLLKADKKGIMCIGHTSKMKQRRAQFVSAIKRASGHSEMNLVYYLEHCTGFKKKFKNSQFQYCFRKCSNVAKSKSEEEQLIKAYFKRFGEVPPLNSAIPNRYEENWEQL